MSQARVLVVDDGQSSCSVLQDALAVPRHLRGLVGWSPAIDTVRDLIRRVAPTGSNVLILGESGTGKEVVARAIHRLSERRDRSLVTINCAALPDTLLESELFGHTKGAFTGASRNKEGLFQAADGGTLFLDEIAAMPIPLQSKILRAVESKEFLPLGATAPVKADLRILAASSSDLAEASQQGRFMDALYYRLNVFEICVPPLRERKADIPVLVEHFVRRVGQKLSKRVDGVSHDAMATLMAYDWPGNVRELENAVERAMLLTDGDQITADSLPLKVQRPPLGPAARPFDLRRVLRECEREHVTAVLALAGQDKVKAARLLGISVSGVYRKLEQPDPGTSRVDAGARLALAAANARPETWESPTRAAGRLPRAEGHT